MTKKNQKDWISGGYMCGKCEHAWIPRDFNKKPKTCPKCKSYKWEKCGFTTS